ncbi:MAG TPA: gamma-glutamyltransferase [Terriglobia bacterium]|nr:gamma-glutamyltransferase [Terriglobia bacterium]
MRHATLLIFSLVTMLIPPMIDAQDQPNALERSQARSMTITERGIVATSQTLASQAGAQILARGGSAVDAAIAANAVLGVVEPMMNGMGGDLFAIEWDAKTGKLTGLNSSGWAPERLTIDFLHHKGQPHMPYTGIYSVTVPGCVRGWEALHAKFGLLPWAELFAPAIEYAKNGFPVTEIIAADWKAKQKKLAADPNARAVFMVNGRTPRVGEIFRNPGYARALELVASQGPDAFYRGEIAQAILKTSDRLGGVMTAEDLADYKPEWVEPISTTYHGWTVYEMPPNSQGMAALEMLNIMERFPLAQYGFASVEAFHVKMEAQKLAYADLYRYNGDPRFAKIPVEGIISKPYAAARAATIDMNHAHCDVQPGEPMKFGTDTIYMSAVDKDGNIVSLIQSQFEGFGSGIGVDNFGFTLQNRGALFVLDPQHPDALAPRKRPFHTIIPAFMEKGNLHMGFGIMGGSNQAQAHAQFVSDVVDHGMNIQAALEAPRFTKPTRSGCDVMIEDRVPAEVRQALTKLGHVLDVRGDFSAVVGGGQAVLHDSATGVNYGASDPRKDGAAIPEPLRLER